MVQLLAGFVLSVLVVVVVAVLGGGAAVVYGVKRMNDEAAALMSTIDMQARVDPASCPDPATPLLVVWRNGNSNKEVTNVSFSVRGYRPGFSNSVADAWFLESDKILKPGETYAACFPVGTGPTPHDIAELDWKVVLHYARGR
jgi:hypothetical protein